MRVRVRVMCVWWQVGVQGEEKEEEKEYSEDAPSNYDHVSLACREIIVQEEEPQTQQFSTQVYSQSIPLTTISPARNVVNVLQGKTSKELQQPQSQRPANASKSLTPHTHPDDHQRWDTGTGTQMEVLREDTVVGGSPVAGGSHMRSVTPVYCSASNPLIHVHQKRIN